MMVAAGLGHVMANIAMQSLLQSRAGHGVQGQALSLYSLLFRTGPSIGALVIGFAATRWRLADVMTIFAVIAGILIVRAGRWVGSVTTATQLTNVLSA
jgi:hypothetical protein